MLLRASRVSVRDGERVDIARVEKYVLTCDVCETSVKIVVPAHSSVDHGAHNKRNVSKDHEESFPNHMKCADESNNAGGDGVSGRLRFVDFLLFVIVFWRACTSGRSRF